MGVMVPFVKDKDIIQKHSTFIIIIGRTLLLDKLHLTGNIDTSSEKATPTCSHNSKREVVIRHPPPTQVTYEFLIVKKTELKFTCQTSISQALLEI